MTANGEVQAREEATENVKALDLLVTVMLLEETLAVLSSGKLCDDHGYAVNNHITPKRARELIAIYQTMCFFCSLCLSKSSSTTATPTSSSSSQDSVFD